MAGSSGGGGGVGSSIPSYLQHAHSEALCRSVEGLPTVHPNKTMVDVFNTALTKNPYIDRHPRNPDSTIAKFDTYCANYQAWADSLSNEDISSIIAKYDDAMNSADLWDTLIPKLKSQYRDIGATFTSTYYTAITKASADLLKERAKLIASLAQEAQKARHSAIPAMYHTLIETERLKAVMLDEYVNQDTSYREHEIKWEIELFGPYGNFFAAVSGGTVPLAQKQPSKLSSALGGAMSGASVGMMASTMPGMAPLAPALIGGGAALGLLGGLFQ